MIKNDACMSNANIKCRLLKKEKRLMKQKRKKKEEKKGKKRWGSHIRYLRLVDINSNNISNRK